MRSNAYLLLAASLEAANIAPDLKTETADTRHLITTNLGINEARQLVTESSSRSLGTKEHSFIIFATGLTQEAQNALLKLFEEPPENTVFYLIVPHESMLLPTLRSRLTKIEEGKTETELLLADKFLALTIAEQMDEIAKKAKDEPESLGLLVKELALKKSGEAPPQVKNSLLLALKYVYNRGASRKMLLEELTLSLNEKTN